MARRSIPTRRRTWPKKLAILLAFTLVIVVTFAVVHVVASASSTDAQWHGVALQINSAQRAQRDANAAGDAGAATTARRQVADKCHIASVLPSGGKWERTVRALCNDAGALIP